MNLKSRLHVCGYAASRAPKDIMLNKNLTLLFLLLVFCPTAYAHDPHAEKPALVADSERTVSVCVGDWPPHVSKELGGGPLVDATKRIFEEAGYTTEIHWAPWRRCLENIKSGIWDASPGWAITTERLKDFIFSEATVSSYHVFFSLKERKFDWNEWSDLKGLHIGATIGYNYGAQFTAHAESELFEIELAASDALNIQKLIKKRFDLFVINKNTAWSVAKSQLSASELDQLELHPKPVSKNRTAHTAFSKRHSEQLLKDFNRGISILKEKGEYERLFDYTDR